MNFHLDGVPRPCGIKFVVTALAVQTAKHVLSAAEVAVTTNPKR
jgi:hypothetical protein